MKLETVAAKTRAVLPHLCCPLCAGELAQEGGSLRCTGGHCYDLSAKGYLNLAPSHNQAKEKYGAELFASRQRVFADGFYQPVADALCDALSRFAPRTIADIGCGEGYYLREMAARFPDACLIGVDISRDAILAAAKQSPAPHWLVADLTHLPLKEHSMDALTDVLTPADYTAFARVLRPGGVLVKIIPADDYLREVREALPLRAEGYSNARVIAHLEEHADVLERRSIRHTRPVTPEQARRFLRMTPMSFGVSEQELANVSLERITIALELFVCKFKG